jgi:hypothetical protein
MGEAYATHGKETTCLRAFGMTACGKKQLGSPKHGWESKDINEIERHKGSGLSGIKRLGYFKHRFGPLGSVKSGRLFD